MELKFVDVIGFRTEDPKFPTANLLQGGKWLCEKKNRSSVNDVTLYLGKVSVISAIDIGNCGSAFVSVEVSRVGLTSYESFLPSTEFMSARDCQAKNNWTSVQMFSEEHFTPGIREQKWDLVRVVCMQPFLTGEQFGLTFFRIFSTPEKDSSPKPELSPPPWSSFAKLRNHSLSQRVPVPKTRSEQLLQAAREQQKSPTFGNSQNSSSDMKLASFNDFSFQNPAFPKSSAASRRFQEATVHSLLRHSEAQSVPVLPVQKGSPRLSEKRNSTPSKRIVVVRRSRKGPTMNITSVESGSDSETSTVESSLQSSNERQFCRIEGLTPLQLEADLDSDAETVIVPGNRNASLPKVQNLLQRSNHVEKASKSDFKCGSSSPSCLQSRISPSSFFHKSPIECHRVKRVAASSSPSQPDIQSSISPGQESVVQLKREHGPPSRKKVKPQSYRKESTINIISVESDSDNETDTIVLPLQSGGKSHFYKVGLSPSRLHTDFDSDTETVIVPLCGEKNMSSQNLSSENLQSLQLQDNVQGGNKVRRRLLSPRKGELTSCNVMPLSSGSVCADRATEILTVDSDEEPEPGPSRIPCPLCSEWFEVSTIELHASSCRGLDTESELNVCPICSRCFPPSVLPQHADLCAERAASLKPFEAITSQ